VEQQDNQEQRGPLGQLDPWGALDQRVLQVLRAWDQLAQPDGQVRRDREALAQQVLRVLRAVRLVQREQQALMGLGLQGPPDLRDLLGRQGPPEP